MTRFPLALFAVALLTACDPARAQEEAAGSFDRPIRLELWGKTLREAVQQITQRSGIDLRVSTEFIRPEEFPQYPLYLHGEVPVRTAIEWLCRSLNCRYRIDGPRSVWLSGSYDWLDPETDILIETIDPLVGPRGQIGDTQRRIEELIKIHTLFSDYSLRVEQEDRKIVAVLPVRLKELLQQSMLAMTRPGQAIADAGAPVLPEDQTRLLTALRRKVVTAYAGQPLQAVLADLALQSGVSISADPQLFRTRRPPAITLDLGEVTLRRAVEAVAAEIGAKGYELYVPGSVFLIPESRPWSFASSRSFLWEELGVASYAVSGISAPQGDALAHHIRRQVYPDTWNDPAAAVVYHPASGNLVVIAPPSVQNAVLRELHRLQTTPQP